MSEKKEWSSKEITFLKKQYSKGHGRKSIAKLFKEKFGYIRNVDSVRHAIDRYCMGEERALPKVLILDIETAPFVSYHWGLWDQNIPLNMIKQDWFVLSWTAKWAHEDKVIYKDQRGKKGEALKNDKKLLEPLWKLLDDADVTITQNGVGFDHKKLNAKFLEHGMGAPSAFKCVDTFKIAKRHFALTSNKLEYMSKKFNTKYKKQDHEDFAGFKLWDECLKGNIKAWNSMQRYNQFDVLATEELFTKLAEFDKTELVTSVMKVYNQKKK
jgi:hypothetical protein